MTEFFTALNGLSWQAAFTLVGVSLAISWWFK